MTLMPNAKLRSNGAIDGERRRFVQLTLAIGSALALGSFDAVANPASGSTSTNALPLTQFGVDPTGKRDSSDAFVRAIRAASQSGNRLLGDPSHIYRLDKTVKVHDSNVTLDMRNAVVTGSGVLIFDGDSGIDGDWSKALKNIHVSNVRFGTGVGSKTRAFRFIYCIDSSMSNVVRHSYGDTGVEMFMCKRTVFHNITSRGGKDEAHGGPHSSEGAIAALMLHCEQCTFDGVSALEGPFVMGIQVKGGSGNVVRNCSISEVIEGKQVRAMKYGFYNRGDAPSGASPTPGFRNHGYSYPYKGGSWSTADARRASNQTKYTDCVVNDCKNVLVAFQTEQFDGGSMTGCRALNNFGGSSFAVTGTPGGNERDFLVSKCESVGATNFGIVVFGSKKSSRKLSGVELTGNTIRDSGYSGIYVIGAADVTITGNEVINSCMRYSRQYSEAILVRESATVSIAENNLKGGAGCSSRALTLSKPDKTNGVTLSKNSLLDLAGAACK